MMRNNPVVFAAVLFALTACLFCIGCGSGHTSAEKDKSSCMKPDSINPNGTSELARLMRNMHAYSLKLREDISNDRPLDSFPSSFQQMYTAKATDPTVRSSAFDNFTESYLNSLQNLYAVESVSRKHAFNGMVDNCITCHNQYCTGPVKMITKLKVGVAGK